MLGMAILAFGLTLADPDSDPAYGYRRYGRYGRYYGGYRKYSPYLSGRGYYGKPHPYAYKPGSTIPFPKVAPKIGADPVLAAQAAEAARGAHAAHAAHNGGHGAHHGCLNLGGESCQHLLHNLLLLLLPHLAAPTTHERPLLDYPRPRPHLLQD